jgi:hypothetical protein
LTPIKRSSIVSIDHRDPKVRASFVFFHLQQSPRDAVSWTVDGHVTYRSNDMGAKLVGPKGNGNGKKGGGNIPLNTGLVSVNLTVSVAKALLGSLTTGVALPQDVAKTVALAVVRALSAGPITKKKSGKQIGKKVVGKKVA